MFASLSATIPLEPIDLDSGSEAQTRGRQTYTLQNTLQITLKVFRRPSQRDGDVECEWCREPGLLLGGVVPTSIFHFTQQPQSSSSKELRYKKLCLSSC